MSEVKIAPSLMCMDLSKFNEQITFLNQNVDSYHVDIMDGHFVPNITLSPWFIEEVKKVSDVPISSHLMVNDMSFWVKKMINLNCDWICMHVERLNGLAFRLIDQIHDAGLKAGVVLNPETAIESIYPYIDLVDKVTIMTVDPGFAGQRFLPVALEKIKQLKELKEKYNYNYVIEVDGSCNEKTFKVIKESGTESFIVGNSGLFNLAGDIDEAWQSMVEKFEKETGCQIK
ncbi:MULTISPECIES: D-allulose 6-phosphate 3-epimerase [Aerococcus]|uniref:D-allulose 6-phosphate 3-epimerase n=1 Tax=Aerococcus urinae (strain CCUG 59500 / ACS-120-V-Col10a) TaxID=2976812 RepID=UPI000200E51B|nr:D-allulose 6-phosphate 3-epimerase [Aerococcus sp. Group 1]AEA01392.1 putative ribulose-phosphate 3-epimerase [Aerococcus sp. Group 1]MCY3030428.1 D-allulose 6-phosphate 3-epimerase [Aerococcus sp. Group 1]MCY3054470.1 D-allulose 6-phosphate 3-epimerase [Aerococcus sp. Group 1]MCY3056200.1 D-allulose 6-phosphate 3-epimerase [Aerococcus sp. Group 1]MCY3061658.1 D-allulose 6-phosphate 3-epimerase [Aerococcus sp. Group 1]